MECDIQRELSALTRRIDAIKRPPATTLEILNLEESERRWEEFLAHFLDPSEPHGFGTAVVECFLDVVVSNSETAFPGFEDLQDVRVKAQVPAGTGFVDLLVWCPNEWFVCIELKSKSPESGTQTKEYAGADTLGTITTDDFPIREYVYLASETATGPSSDDFTHVAWEAVVDHFDQVGLNDQQEFPRKSRAQLDDYLDTIRRTLNMGEFTELSAESEAYIAHSEAIERAVKAYRKDRKRMFNRIRDEFYKFQEVDRSGWGSNIGTRQNRVELYKYIQIYKNDWRGSDFGSKIEYEVHALFTEDFPKFSVRLDVERDSDGEVRGKLDEQIDDGIKKELRADGWEFDTSNSEYWYLRKEIEFDSEDHGKSVKEFASEVNNLHEMVGKNIDAVVTEASRT